jgi:hypothetical protein
MPAPYKPDQLTRLKIAMREVAARAQGPNGPMTRRIDPRGSADPLRESQAAASTIGKNDGTVRFLFGPESAVGVAV